jgi:hypothetical protein
VFASRYHDAACLDRDRGLRHVRSLRGSEHERGYLRAWHKTSIPTRRSWTPRPRLLLSSAVAGHPECTRIVLPGQSSWFRLTITDAEQRQAHQERCLRRKAASDGTSQVRRPHIAQWSDIRAASRPNDLSWIRPALA